ncbi:hypothetical protein ACFXPQ_19550 [Streptomyces lydicus]|uniref:hypothetical protein n=1 Tax=Streptomyces lydicus TaxID=47763 RepID=UPI003674EEBF
MIWNRLTWLPMDLVVVAAAGVQVLGTAQRLAALAALAADQRDGLDRRDQSGDVVAAAAGGDRGKNSGTELLKIDIAEKAEEAGGRCLRRNRCRRVEAALGEFHAQMGRQVVNRRWRCAGCGIGELLYVHGARPVSQRGLVRRKAAAMRFSLFGLRSLARMCHREGVSRWDPALRASWPFRIMGALASYLQETPPLVGCRA